MKIHQKREIKRLNSDIKNLKSSYAKKIKESKKCKKSFKKADLKNMSIGRAMSIVKGPERLSGEMEQKIGEIKEKIAKITKMNLKEYIDYKNGKDKVFEENNNFEEDDDTMTEEIEKKINQIEEICKKNKIIKYPKNFKF